MPHLTIEYSSNLDALVDINGLCVRLAGVIKQSGLFEIGAVRVRAFRADHAVIADELIENGFLDMSFRIGAGRTPDEKKAVGRKLFEAAGVHLATLFETPHFALSLEIREIDAALSWKRNAIHPRLRAQSGEEPGA